MCGIFGIYGNHKAATLTQLGLYSLQHRGQESAGIVAVDDHGVARAVKAMGLVSEGFKGPELETLRGPIAIGHTRYSTAGRSGIENAQPILAHVRRGHIALAHNGNLTNAVQLRRELEDQGAIFTGTMDSEVVVHRIARASGNSPEERVAVALKGVEGAYCLLVLIDETLIVARDPHGFRPLVMGRIGDGYVFASETCALDIVGATLEREIKPGEIAAIDRQGFRSMQAFEVSTVHRCVFEHVYFARPDSTVFGSAVSNARRALGRRLAIEHPAPGADLVFAVPDSSNSAALGFAEESGIPFELALIRNHYVGRTFIQPTQASRDAKVKVKFNPVRELLKGKSVVMVDDSIVRGTTTRGLVSLIRAAGVKELHMRVSSAPVIAPCYYGIDTPRREELVAAQMSHDELVRHLGVDTLGYLTIEGMLAAMPDGPDNYCFACFSGRYPTPIPGEAQSGVN